MAKSDDQEKKAKASEPKAKKAEKAAKGESAPKAASKAKEPKKAETKGEKSKAAAAKSAPKKEAGAGKAPKAAKAKAHAHPHEDESRRARAHAKYVRMAPRKLRLVMDAIRGKSVQEARGILQFCGKRAAKPLSKVLESAVANAENNHHMDKDNLLIATAYVDQGPSFKSFIPRARGRASAIHKFMSHITIELKEREEA